MLRRASMQATTATPRAGGSGSGPEKDSAYRALLRSSSSVTDMAVLLTKGNARAQKGRGGPVVVLRGRATELVELDDAPARPEGLEQRAQHGVEFGGLRRSGQVPIGDSE